MRHVSRQPGRPRDRTLDVAILEAAAAHLAAKGYEAMSLVAIAEDAGTTRQALYRRWPSKADLATATIAHLAQEAERPETDDVFADLVQELRSFRQGVSRPNGLSMIGAIMQAGPDAEFAHLFRERVVVPRRAALRTLLQRAADQGRIDAQADLDTATAACTGSYYAAALAGVSIGERWPEQTAAFVWRACGGTVE